MGIGHNMNYTEIKTALLNDGYKDTPELDKTIRRLLFLDGEVKEMLHAWISYGIFPSFIYQGIDSNTLHISLGMKAPAIILAFYMLQIQPKSKELYLRLLKRNIEYKLQINR